MLFDKQNQFSENQAVTTTAFSTNAIDFGEGKGDPAFGAPKSLVIQVVEDFAGATSVTVSVQTATDKAFTTPKTLDTSGAIALAQLKAGYKFPINYLPKGILRYARLNYTVAGAGTAGKITAGLVAADDNSYQDWTE